MTARATVLLGQHVNSTMAHEMNVLGLGWSLAGPDPIGPHQVILVIESDDPNWLDDTREFTLQLVGDDQEVVEAPGPDGTTRPIRLKMIVSPADAEEFDTTGFRGVRSAVSVGIDLSFPLEPGRYSYQFSLHGDESEPLAQAHFRVRAKPEDQVAMRPIHVELRAE